VIIGALLGAEEFGFGTTVLISLGCILMRKCHQNTCPVGIATQDPILRKRFRGQPEHLINFMRFLAREIREIMAELGFRKFDDMIGRSDMLEVNEAIDHFKVKGLDFTKVFHSPDVPQGSAKRCINSQKIDFSLSLDKDLIAKAKDALENNQPVQFEMPLRNFNRSVGTTLSYQIAKRFGSKGLPDNSIKIKFTGSAGQSFGAFLAPGITFILEGDANDYFGKGLSGGRIIVKPPIESTFIPQHNIITGNVNLFGATSGEVYIHGMAGERFCVRNSGALAVVEGVGDHCCEYMTGGRVIVLGRTGVNFAAGMSGGIAYVLDENQLFDTLCNLEMVDIEPVSDPKDIRFLMTVIRNHMQYTGSKHAAQILENWDDIAPYFVKVMPIDYRRALERIKEQESKEASVIGMTEEVYA
jgi:glutamate synthase domain-containing protein 3